MLTRYTLPAVLALASMSGSGVKAAAIDPRCSEMVHKVSCTCAMQNSGFIKPSRGEMRWFMAPNTQDAVNRCVKAAGGEPAY
jgi:hypothetical protein